MWGQMKDVSPLKEFVHSDILLFAAIETLQIDKMICCITSRDPVWGTTESFSENPNGWCRWWLIHSWPHLPSWGSKFSTVGNAWVLSLMRDLQLSWWWPCFLQYTQVMPFLLELLPMRWLLGLYVLFVEFCWRGCQVFWLLGFWKLFGWRKLPCGLKFGRTASISSSWANSEMCFFACIVWNCILAIL